MPFRPFPVVAEETPRTAPRPAPPNPASFFFDWRVWRLSVGLLRDPGDGERDGDYAAKISLRYLVYNSFEHQQEQKIIPEKHPLFDRSCNLWSLSLG